MIGFDARHNSDVFARDTAEVMTGAGLNALALPRPLPTPLLAFAIRELGCVAGVMVTASHNPPQDNGYKVYLGDGSQIVPPADVEIAAQIAAVGAIADVPRGDARHDARRGHRRPLPRHRRRAGRRRPARPQIVYTPLHGVGGTSVLQVLESAGFAAPYVVEQQEHPDPDFPTVVFPNPEEPGAMDLAMALAEEHGRRPRGRQRPGRRPLRGGRPDARTAGGCCAATRWARCSAHHLLARGRRAPTPTRSCPRRCSGKMAAAAGQPHEETLTGFKWIGRVEGLAFGYEEALGYCVDPEHVKDKDGVSALLLLCELAAAAKARAGAERPARRHRHRARAARHRPAVGAGDDLSEIGAAMDRLRGHSAGRHSAAWRSSRSTTSRSARRTAADRRPAVPDGRRRPGHRAARAGPSPSSSATSRSWSRWKAERRRRPDLRCRPTRRPQGRPAGARARVCSRRRSRRQAAATHEEAPRSPTRADDLGPGRLAAYLAGRAPRPPGRTA